MVVALVAAGVYCDLHRMPLALHAFPEPAVRTVASNVVNVTLVTSGVGHMGEISGAGLAATGVAA